MLILGLSAWVIAIILTYKNKIAHVQWLARYSVLAGCGAFANILAKNLVPYLAGHITNRITVLNTIKTISGLLHTVSYSGSPYAFLVFAVLYTNFFNFKSEKQKYLTLSLLFIPVIIMFVLFPIFDMSHKAFAILNIWTVPYTLLGCSLLFWSYITEKESKKKQQKFLVFITVSPTNLFLLATVYLCPYFGAADAYKYNTLLILSMIMLCLFAIRYGFLGFKLSFQKYYMDNTMKAVISGTSLLNHTIKNEITNMSISLTNLKDNIGSNPSAAAEDIQFLEESLDHLSNMTTRIQDKTQEIILIKQPNNINDIIENSLYITKPLFENKKINVVKEFNAYPVISCDKVHIEEVLCNIFKNAIEAMSVDGTLHILTYKYKKQLVLSIKDNGIGIPEKNLAHIIEPFFSTKSRQSNYGLGLTYCYNVMEKHGGLIEFQSKEKNGTIVTLKFPLAKDNTIFRTGKGNHRTKDDLHG